MKRRTMPVKHAELIVRVDMAITRQIETATLLSTIARYAGKPEEAAFQDGCAMTMAHILGGLEERQFPGDDEMRMNMLDDLT